MTTAIAELAATETYRDLERMVEKLIRWAVEHRGGDRDDYASAANQAYTKAIRTHDPARGQITTHVWWCVKNALQSVAIREWKHRERERNNSPLPNDLTQRPRTKGFDVEVLLVDLSDDARAVVRLVIDTPGDLVKLVRMRSPDRMRGLLARGLRDLGWTIGRVVESFDEIREALT